MINCLNGVYRAFSSTYERLRSGCNEVGSWLGRRISWITSKVGIVAKTDAVAQTIFKSLIVSAQKPTESADTTAFRDELTALGFKLWELDSFDQPEKILVRPEKEMMFSHIQGKLCISFREEREGEWFTYTVRTERDEQSNQWKWIVFGDKGEAYAYSRFQPTIKSLIEKELPDYQEVK